MDRWLLFSAGGFTFGVTLVVAVSYMLAWRKAPRVQGALPLHVWMVAASYDLLVLGVMVQAMTNPLRWWHWSLYAPALLLGTLAMFALGRPSHRGSERGGSDHN